MAIVSALLFGAVLGWVNSLLVRSNTNERIMIDILVGALGAVILAEVTGADALFDSLVAAFAGAVLACAVLFAARRSWRVR